MAPDHFFGPFGLLLNGYWDSFTRVKWSECDVDHSPPSRPKVRNVWCYTSSLPLCLYGVNRDSLVIT